MTYAVYVVMIEDTQEDDQHLLGSVVSGERLAGDLSEGDAEGLVTDIGSSQFDRDYALRHTPPSERAL